MTSTLLVAKSITTGSSAWGDYSVQAQIKPGTTVTGTSNVLAARYTDANNSYSLILKDGNTWYFGKKVNGVWTTFANGFFRCQLEIILGAHWGYHPGCLGEG